MSSDELDGQAVSGPNRKPAPFRRIGAGAVLSGVAALLAAALILVAGRVVTMRQAYRAVDWSA